MKTRAAIYGGSFNPPHLGHIKVIGALIDSNFCDEIWLMPSISREHMKISTPGKFRLKMLQIIVNKFFPDPKIPIIFSDFEIDQTKEITTYHTKIELEQKNPAKDFLFVIGSDVLSNIPYWPDGNKLLVTTKFILINRKTSLYKSLPENILVLPNFQPLDISSTYIRYELKNGIDVSKYVTPEIYKYIKANGLYQF